MHPFFVKILHAGRAELFSGAGPPPQLALEILLEQNLNAGTRTYSSLSRTIAGLAPEYMAGKALQPHSGLRSYPFDQSRFRFFSQDEKKRKGESAALLVHPDSAAKKRLARAESLAAMPFLSLDFFSLASLRSVLFFADGQWQRAKLHLQDVRISRYYRNLGGRTIEHSLAVSRALRQSWDDVCRIYRQKAATALPGLGFYEEFAGTVLANSVAGGGQALPALPYDDCRRDGEWGSLRRRLNPYGAAGWNLVAIPLFAFYGKNPAAADGTRTLLWEMIAESGEKPVDFICRRLLEPVIRAWVAVFAATGIIWEPHAQNLVFLCDLGSLEPRFLALRDADTAVSAARRQELGLSTSEFSPRNLLFSRPGREMPLGERSEISRVLDISMGSNTFAYLARLYTESFAGQADELKVFCRRLFREIWPAWNRWLPEQVYGYAEQPLPEDRNCYPLLPRGELPAWRPF